MFLDLLLAATLPIAVGGADEPQLRRLAVAQAETLAVTVAGSGRPVVLVPGLLGAAFTFRHVQASLVQARYHVVIVEPLGTGSSSRPEDADYSLTAQSHRIAAALDTLGVRSAVLVCHSVGASMCYRMAARRADLVAGIVSVNGGAAERAGTPGLRSALRFAPLLALFGAEGLLRGKIQDGLVASSYDPGWVTDDVVRGYTAPFDEDLGAALSALKRMLGAREPEALRPQLARIRVPVRLLVGVGGSGDAVPPDEVETLRAELADFRADSVPRAGQYIQEERPAVVVGAVLALVAELDRRRAMPSVMSGAAAPVAAGSAVDPAASAVDAAGPAANATSSAVDATASSVDATGSAVGPAGFAVDASGSAMDAAGSAADATGSAVDAAGSPVDATGSAMDAARSAVNAAGSTVDAAASALTATDSPAGPMPAGPMVAPGRVSRDRAVPPHRVRAGP
ncbi:MAG TPA: alpha/beta fold hydrolase [Longimicrobiales bacterium]